MLNFHRLADESSEDCNEEDRLSALEDLELLDTPESESFDRITRMASQLFRTPISAVSLTDRNRQWFKSSVGTSGREIPREGAPCAEVTRSEQALLIPDMREDWRFSDCLLARSGIRFYAGAPLTTRDGYVLGAMCVLDQKPRAVSDEEMAALHDFAAMVMSQIELQRNFGRVDPLSGLPNRNQFSEDFEDLRRKNPQVLGVAVLIDLADAKQLNEFINVLGSSFIDDLIKNSSQIVKKTLGRKQGIYHVGTAAIAMLLEDADGEQWQSVVDKLAQSLNAPTVLAGVPVMINAVFGISPFDPLQSSSRHLLRTALSAAHDARQLHLDRAVYSSASDQSNHRKFTLLSDMRQALKREGELALVYQPRLDVRTGVCVGAEALLRWRTPNLGSVPPGEFIPLVEQTALARPVTQWVLKTALNQAKQWREMHIDVRVSINVSACNLEEDDFAESVASALEQRGLPPGAIELEFTESALIRNRSRVLTQLQEIRRLGVELAIDDFGTGYSSFSYLKTLPATTMKIDQSFIRTLSENAVDQKLVHSIVSMAHDIGYRVVAEGVETAEIYGLLRDMNCDEVQGYFFARPLPVEQFENWLERGRDQQMISGLAVLQRSKAPGTMV